MLKQIPGLLKRLLSHIVTKLVKWIQAHPELASPVKKLMNRIPSSVAVLRWLERSSTTNAYTLYFTRENAPVTMIRIFRNLNKAIDKRSDAERLRKLS